MKTVRDSDQDRGYCLRGWIAQTERRLLLVLGENVIGSSGAADLVLPVPGVSRRHALLIFRLRASGATQDAERLTLEDLGSRNGTFVNGRRIDRGEVRPGDELRFGPVELQLEEIDAGDAVLGVVLPAPAVEPPPFSEERTVGFTERAPAERSLLPEDLEFPSGYVPGRSAAMIDFYQDLRPLLAADLSVLIEGETGVGKELVARTLHLSSRRRAGPFVAVNCAAIPADLLEAEMFGIGDGVATGVRKRQGRFRLAEGGTLFLDEIGEMPLELQAKLLRALQEKEIQPLGGAPIRVDVRVVAATNADLLGKADQDRFRRDLYYRVAGSILRLPPLRERRGDVPILIEHFLKRFIADSGKSIPGVTLKALRALERHPWPGNVRELEHEVKRLVYLCADRQAIDSTMLAERLLRGEATAEPEAEVESLRLEDHVRQTERRVIRLALERAGGSQRQAARLLEISRNTLARKIRQLGIET